MAAVLLAVPLINKWTTSRRFVAWRDDLSVGIGSIDDDHKKLLTLINNLQTAVYYPTGEGVRTPGVEAIWSTTPSTTSSAKNA